MKKLFTMLIILLPAFAAGYARPAADSTVMFRFVAGSDMFYIPWEGNGDELERLYAWVDEHRADITAGRLPVQVDGYCASLPTEKENLTTAFIRANRVKSELITHKGLKEADFVTANYAGAYHNNKDMVVVTLRIPAEEPEVVAKEEPPVETIYCQEPAVEKEPQPKPGSTPEPVQAAENTPEPVADIAPAATVPVKPYCFAVRTNVLYDAILLPTLGVEWRINRNIGIKLDGSLAWWNGNHGKVQKMWLLNPEVRWYLLRNKRLYVGASGNYSRYNIYRYAIGSSVSKDTGYQGTMWDAGVTVGYQLFLSRSFSIDFNLGLGYARFDYDRFGITDGVRIYKQRDCTKNIWGPTQAGVSLVWTIGGNK